MQKLSHEITQDILSPTTYSKMPVISQTRLLRALSTQILNTLKDRDCRTSLGNWYCGWTVCMMKKALLIPSVKVCYFNLRSLSFVHPLCTCV